MSPSGMVEIPHPQAKLLFPIGLTTLSLLPPRDCVVTVSKGERQSGSKALDLMIEKERQVSIFRI
jgi:hypothetical protein